MDEILIIDAVGHSKSRIDLIEKTGLFKIKGLIGTKEEINNKI